jgi:hypothetical protein
MSESIPRRKRRYVYIKMGTLLADKNFHFLIILVSTRSPVRVKSLEWGVAIIYRSRRLIWGQGIPTGMTKRGVYTA